ncbi:hypothetical protein [Methylopila sp. M107]|uniref:hypothetical protein n=1 Tax=Methylopila sp. M107 TaxID=1101190 RepID=UPI00037EBAD9|nr:hypothetical protein [Methylopila sp. M107]
MTREQAQALINAIVALDTPFEAVEAALAALETKVERDELRRAFGNVMGLIYTDVMIPAIRQYPELDPDRD